MKTEGQRGGKKVSPANEPRFNRGALRRLLLHLKKKDIPG